MLSRSKFTSLVVGVFAVYVAHTCWVMYGIVYTRPCPASAAACIWPYLARRPKLQVSAGPVAIATAERGPGPHGTPVAMAAPEWGRVAPPAQAS